MITIAIDGPSGAGKSTIAKLLAKKLDIMYLDTGAMYRCLGLKALKSDLDVKDEAAVKSMLDRTLVDVRYIDGVQKVFLDEVDVTSEIREHAVSKMASDISAVPCVRIKMAESQREIAKKRDCVLDGRDIGSYVLPDAKFKFFLTASAEVRACRRVKELAQKGQDLPYEQVLSDIKMRDYNDSHRQIAPLVQVSDAVLIDSSFLSVDEVINKFLEVIGDKKRV